MPPVPPAVVVLFPPFPNVDGAAPPPAPPTTALSDVPPEPEGELATLFALFLL